LISVNIIAVNIKKSTTAILESFHRQKSELWTKAESESVSACCNQEYAKCTGLLNAHAQPTQRTSWSLWLFSSFLCSMVFTVRATLAQY